MRSTLAFLSVIALALIRPATAQAAVTGLIVPSAAPPAGCENSRTGTFTITIVNVTSPAATPSKRDFNDFHRRQSAGVLTLTLDGGVMHDQANRTGYIASNFQFQFDGPPQNGAIYTAGWSICSNGSLALGGNAIFWQCLSGAFFNLYDRNWAVTCNAVYIDVIGGAGPVFSTTATGPESTGPSTATISNAGVPTSAANATGVGIGGGSTSTSMPVSASASTTMMSTTMMSSSASTPLGSGTNSGTAPMSNSASTGTESATAAATSSGNDAVGMASASQSLLALAAGILGAAALL